MKLPRALTIPRAPDFVIGDPAKPYLRRWWVIPRNRFFNIYLHQILADDDDRALHTHPWVNCSILLKGGYIEHLPEGKMKFRRKFFPYFRKASAAHRLELYKKIWVWRRAGLKKRLEFIPIQPAWSLFITGPKIQEWGFICPQGFKHWRDYLGIPEGEARGNEKGKGCAE